MFLNVIKKDFFLLFTDGQLSVSSRDEGTETQLLADGPEGESQQTQVGGNCSRIHFGNYFTVLWKCDRKCVFVSFKMKPQTGFSPFNDVLVIVNDVFFEKWKKILYI